MANDFDSPTALAKYLSDSLGAGSVVVELKPNHYTVAIKKACDILNHYLPGWRRIALNAGAAQKRYVLPLDSMPGFMDVINVTFVRADLLGTPGISENPFILAGRAAAYNGLGMSGYGDFAQTVTHLKEAEKVFSVEPEWEGHWETLSTPNPDAPDEPIITRVFALYIDMSDMPLPAPYNVSVVYAHHFTPTADLLNGLPSIPPQRHIWVKKYAEAVCKQILGRIRNKFHGIGGSQDGSSFETDGGDLIAEAQQEMAELETELKRMKRQIPILLG